MKQIQVLSTSGWYDYCDVGVETDMRDVEGNILRTGDVVEVVDLEYGEDYLRLVNVTMIVFDQHMKFITTDKFFAAGWLNFDWENESLVMRKVDHDRLPEGVHYKIVD